MRTQKIRAKLIINGQNSLQVATLLTNQSMDLTSRSITKERRIQINNHILIVMTSLAITIQLIRELSMIEGRLWGVSKLSRSWIGSKLICKPKC